MKADDIADKLLEQIDLASRDLTTDEWIELCLRIAASAKERAEAARATDG